MLTSEFISSIPAFDDGGYMSSSVLESNPSSIRVGHLRG